MSKQNVYDNNVFFENFQSNRSNDVNFNEKADLPHLYDGVISREQPYRREVANEVLIHIAIMPFLSSIVPLFQPSSPDTISLAMQHRLLHLFP